MLTEHIDNLREAVRDTRARAPFQIDAWTILPEHMHCVWTLPPGDANYSGRWRSVKKSFSKAIETGEWRSAVQRARGERGIWQRRFWEHTIRDDEDYARHVDYVHFNPVKHGFVSEPAGWPHSSFHRAVEAGLYPADWACPSLPEADWGERS